MTPTLEQWIRKYFPSDQVPQATNLLSTYGTEVWHREPDRVLRDMVILSRGSMDKLREVIELAKNDYRDVLIGEEMDPWLMDQLKDPPL